MPTEQEVAYHRSFLSPYYLENLRSPGWFAKKRKPEEIETIRRRNPDEFERVREILAKAIDAQHVRGMYVTRRNEFATHTEWLEGNPKDYLVAEVIVHTSLPQGAVKHPTTGQIALPRVGNPLTGYVQGRQLHPTLMYPKMDQAFETYATPFERTWSSLIPNAMKWQFHPIVDQNFTVIGHTSSGVKASDPSLSPLIVPLKDINQLRSGAGHGGSLPYEMNNPDFFLRNGIPIFVTPLAVPRYGADNRFSITYVAPPRWTIWNFAPGLASTNWLVHTLLDGEVVHMEMYSTPSQHVESVGFTPFDLLGVAKVVVYLGAKIGSRLTRAYVLRAESKREARKALNGATEELANKSKAKLARHVGAGGAGTFRGLKLSRGYDPRMGIPEEHLKPMIEAAKEAQVIAMFRANKAVAIPLIRQGAHGKPMWAKFKTSKETGVLTAATKEEIETAYKNGAFVVHADQVARRTARRVTMQNGKEVIEEVPLNGNWKVEPGQVVMKDGKPIVGDYDLLGVAPIKSPGRNINVVPEDAVFGNWTGPDVEKYRKAVNPKLDKPRVLHGAQDGYGGKPEYRGLTDDTAYAVFPDGRTYIMEGRQAQQNFYDALGRQAKSKEPAPVGRPDWHKEGNRVIQGGKK
jgi:hypothetical protein